MATSVKKDEKKEHVKCPTCNKARVRMVYCPPHDNRLECDQCITSCTALEEWGIGMRKLGWNKHLSLKYILQEGAEE